MTRHAAGSARHPSTARSSDKPQGGRVDIRSYDRTLEMDFSGYVTADCVGKANGRLSSLSAVRWVLFDTTAVDGFEAKVRKPGKDLMDRVENLGAEWVLTVAPSSTVRLLGSALSLGRKCRIQFFETRSEAERRLGELRA